MLKSTFLKSFRRFYCSNNNLSVLNVLKSKKEGDFIQVKGWVKSLRKLKENIFLDVGDGSCTKRLQVIIPKGGKKPEELMQECSIIVNGKLDLSPKGQLELQADNLEICGKSNLTEGYPFLPRKTYSADYVRNYPHIRGRTNLFSSVLRIRNKATLLIHQYLNEKGYCLINTPILTGNDCEGAGEVFKVIPDNLTMLNEMKKEGIAKEEESFFDKKVFLTVSGQLHLEAFAHGLSKVYTFGPTFRAENSKSRMHLSEFYMLEVETAFQDKLEDLMNTIEDLIKTTTKQLMENKDSLEDLIKLDPTFEEKHKNWLESSSSKSKFAVLKYEEAIRIIGAKNKEDLTKEDELNLVKHVGNKPLFIINFPKSLKPFYMKECQEEEEENVEALDLIVPNVGELVGGSLRENNYEKLKAKLPSENLNWYLDLRKFGGVPTSGFGLGFERYIQFLCNINNIKDTIPFPRWAHNCSL